MIPMKTTLLFILCAFGLFLQLRAQVPAAPLAKAVATRQVSGVVVDSLEQGLPGVSVTLTSLVDTLRTVTNEEGIYRFSNVKSWEFTLSVSLIGYRGMVKKGQYNDTKSVLVLQPIVLTSQSVALKEVVLNGRPSIVHKTDTVEYRASDYIVREGSSVSDLLKKMEGMYVSKSGDLSYNGQPVENVRLNGRDFMDRKVSSTIQLLPADIVDKIQIIDDYGDMAARTGLKDGPSKKLLNITTKADRSVGYVGTVKGGIGNNGRYEGLVNGFQVHANRTITATGEFSNTVNGVAGIPGGGQGPVDYSAGNGGTTSKSRGNLSYNDQWSPKMNVNMSYSYADTRVATDNNSTAQEFSTKGTTLSLNRDNAISRPKDHQVKAQFDYEANKANFLRISPTFSYTSAFDDTRELRSLSGLVRQEQSARNTLSGHLPQYDLTVFYQHLFGNKGRNISLQLTGAGRDNAQDREQNTNMTYLDALSGTKLDDSLMHRMIDRNNVTRNYRASATYTEPLSERSILQFNGQVNYNGYDNQMTTNDLNSGTALRVDSLSNAFAYSFTQARLSANYRYKQKKYNLSLGLTAVPAVLSGTNRSAGTSLRRTSFNLIPILRLEYAWSSQQKFSADYSGRASEPVFEQIQPVRDATDPQRPVIGNPDLRATFTHSLNGMYYNYLPNARVSINAGLNATVFRNQVVGNIVQVADAHKSLRYERYFSNVNGAYQTSGNYTITKALNDTRFMITVAGNASRMRQVGLSNNVRSIANQWQFRNRLNVRMDLPDVLELNPSVNYAYTVSRNSLPGAAENRLRTLSLGLDGQVYAVKSWTIGYTVSKTYFRGINTQVAADPFILNTYVERSFLKRRSGKISIHAFDLLKQNQFINRSVGETSITDSRSSALSRYFMLRASFNLQVWKGTIMRNNKPMERRGDGSFIYN